MLSRKLAEWWTLDFASFRDEVKRVFRIEIPVKERGDWESYLAEKAQRFALSPPRSRRRSARSMQSSIGCSN